MIKFFCNKIFPFIVVLLETHVSHPWDPQLELAPVDTKRALGASRVLSCKVGAPLFDSRWENMRYEGPIRAAYTFVSACLGSRRRRTNCDVAL